MGLFLSMSGIVGSSRDEVAAALRDFSTSHAGHFRPATAAEDEDTRLIITPGPAGITVFYPEGFVGWEEASEYLSQRLRTPTFSFHIHDGDLWMFQLYVDGKVRTAFNPIPDYWGDLPPEEMELMRGNPKIVAEHVPHVQVGEIERYLVQWDLDDEDQEKAYPGDEFSRGEDWQLVDFMKKLGFVYPLDARGVPLGECYSFSADSEK